MARLRHNFGSMLSGKTDGMVFVQMNGETYMRVHPGGAKVPDPSNRRCTANDSRR